jgi:DNA-binding response OmpR family regulator
MMDPHSSRRRRVLIVEDETVIAMILEEVLGMLDCDVVGPASKLEIAIGLAREEPIDAAVLDVTIRGGQVFPVADILLGRGIPFLLSSGYGEWALPAAFQRIPRLQKPFTINEAVKAIRAVVPAC